MPIFAFRSAQGAATAACFRPCFQAFFLFLPALLLLVGCRQEAPAKLDYAAEKSAIYTKAAVSGPHPLATAVAEQVLQAGGNAIDAAVAMQFAMAVCYPRAGNLGGGGFLVYRSDSGETSALDYRERAPAAAHRDMYLNEAGEVIEGLSLKGHLAAGVPGTVAGTWEMHQKYGSMEWAALLQPAIDLAAKGFLLSEAEAERLNGYQAAFRAYNNSGPFIQDTFLLAQRFIQTDLAQTLIRIQEKGRAGFYEGKTAALIVAEMQSGQGLISLEDLAAYRPSWRQPIVKAYRDYRIISMPPSSSGGVALGQILGMLAPYDLSSLGFHSPEAIHLMAEAERRAYADRAEYLGDSDFYPVPVQDLLQDSYLLQRMQDFRTDSSGRSEAVLAGNMLTKETFETTHISIVDSAGNAVSITTTLNGNFGCKVIVDGAGFFLNNEMDDFSAKPGVPNMFGLVGKEANAIAPGKRMLSSMTPTIVEKDGELFLVLGAPGGSTIITAVAQVIVNVVDFGMPIDSAINAARFHHQWLPDQLLIESQGFSAATRQALENKGHSLKEVGRMAVVKAIHRKTDGSLHAAADFRNPDDDVAGW